MVGDGNTVTIDREAIQLMNAVRDRAREDLASAGKTSAIDVGETRSSLALEAPKHMTLRGKHGTAINVKGRWYVQLEGEGGVLNPLKIEPGVSIEDDQSYSFYGDWEGRSYRIQGAHPIGRVGF